MNKKLMCDMEKYKTMLSVIMILCVCVFIYYCYEKPYKKYIYLHTYICEYIKNVIV
jgi:hypothetical protein